MLLRESVAFPSTPSQRCSNSEVYAGVNSADLHEKPATAVAAGVVPRSARPLYHGCWHRLCFGADEGQRCCSVRAGKCEVKERPNSPQSWFRCVRTWAMKRWRLLTHKDFTQVSDLHVFEPRGATVTGRGLLDTRGDFSSGLGNLEQEWPESWQWL